MKRGRRTTPAVQVLAVSSVRSGLPPSRPEMLEFSGEVGSPDGLKPNSRIPSAPSTVAQLACRKEVP